MGPRSVVVYAGGDAPPAGWQDHLPEARPGAVVAHIAADSGLDHALAAGIVPDRLVGDLDSVSAAGLAAATAAGVTIERHPVDKDRTDLALAMGAAHRIAVGAGAGIVVVGGHGGRVDHLLGNVTLLASPEWADVEVRAVMGAALVTVVRGRRLLHGRPATVVSLLPVHGTATGVATTGLRWPLHDATLVPGTTWAMSNEFTEQTASVEVADGVLLAVQPDVFA